MDLILRNANVVDGTGQAPRAADVGITDGRITEVGTIPADTPGEVIDLDGLVLAPGFIDIHTHFDAQILWDPDLTPSCWHGVTTVVMGNCGFGIAPTRPEHRGAIARTLENVEGMSVAALEAGIPWTFETFPQYLDTVEAIPTRLNVGTMVGHTPIRLYVLGEDATERAATDAEIQRMRDLVAEALDAGAMGFATSKAAAHVGDGGKPVPSRLAEKAEVFAIAEALREAGHGTMLVSAGPGLSPTDCANLSEHTGRPVSWVPLLTGKETPAMEMLERQSGLGGQVWPQIACRPVVMQVSLADPFPYASAPSFNEILTKSFEERCAYYRDPAWRERARSEMVGVYSTWWSKTTVEETTAHTALQNGPSLAELAEERSVHPLDVMLDLALEEDLATRFGIRLANDDPEEIGRLLQDPRTLLGLSDAGAHASQLCDAVYCTYLLEHWVREKRIISLEQAVWRLTGQPAEIFGLTDRGRIAEGMAADLVAFDPERIAVEPPRRVWDLPAGADRLVAGSRGIEAIWVNGTPIRWKGQDIEGARPGILIRQGS